MKMFCPITKASKSKKPSHQPSTRNNEVSQDVNNHNIDNQHASTIPYRYVTTEFQAKAPDELTVLPGEVVFWHYSDNSNNGNWSYVALCLSDRKDLTKKEGFVPSEILTTEPERNLPCKKKLPRSTTNSIKHHSHHLHRHNTHIAQPSINEEIHRFHQHQHVCEHQPGSFGAAHSLQGSSGKQSFQKYPDLRNFNPPAYSNLRASDPQHEPYAMDIRPFHLENYGVYIVIYNFIAREENDLNVKPGEMVHVLNKDDEDWFWVKREDDLAEGFVPSGFICDQEQVKSILNKGNSTVTMKSSNHNDFHTYINHNPDRESLATDQQSTAFQHSFEINKLLQVKEQEAWKQS